jgi:hypothetical protein
MVHPMRHHADAAAPSAPLDPVAVTVWRHGLTGAPAAPTLVIHAPHASELVSPETAPATPHADAA